MAFTGMYILDIQSSVAEGVRTRLSCLSNAAIAAAMSEELVADCVQSLGKVFQHSIPRHDVLKRTDVE